MYLGSWKVDDYLTFTANTHTPDSGAATDADSVPTYRIYEDETGTAIATGSTAKLDDANTTGFYSERIQLLAATGFEKGKTYTIYISGTVGGVTGTMSHTFQIEAEVDANIVSDKTGYSLAADQSSVTVGTVNTLTGHTVQTGDSYPIITNGTYGLSALNTDISAILVDTNELQTDWTNGGRLDLLLDATLADTNELQTDWTNSGRLDLLLDATLADTAELQADLTNGGRLDLLIDGIKTKTDSLPSGIEKNVALSNFEFYMVLATDHVSSATGKTISGKISKDGSGFVTLTNTISEMSDGMYRVNITQAEMNADVITLKFTATGCDQRVMTIYTM